MKLNKADAKAALVWGDYGEGLSAEGLDATLEGIELGFLEVHRHDETGAITVSITELAKEWLQGRHE